MLSEMDLSEAKASAVVTAVETATARRRRRETRGKICLTGLSCAVLF